MVCNFRRSFEVAVQSDHGMPEPAAKVIYYAHHAQGHSANPKAREHVEDVPGSRRRRRGPGGYRERVS